MSKVAIMLQDKFSNTHLKLIESISEPEFRISPEYIRFIFEALQNSKIDQSYFNIRFNYWAAWKD